MTPNPQRNTLKFARRRRIVGITATSRGGGAYGLLLGVVSLCILAPKNPENLIPSLDPPDEANASADEHAKTEQKLYFNAPKLASIDIETCEKRTSETVGTN